jgi:hypothetical protein
MTSSSFHPPLVRRGSISPFVSPHVGRRPNFLSASSSCSPVYSRLSRPSRISLEDSSMTIPPSLLREPSSDALALALILAQALLPLLSLCLSLAGRRTGRWLVGARADANVRRDAWALWWASASDVEIRVCREARTPMACTASWHSSIARQTTLNEPSRFVPYPLRRRDQSVVCVLSCSQLATYCICEPHGVSYVAHASHSGRTSYLKPSCFA